MHSNIITYLKTPTNIAPLAVFRVLFGCLMMFATMRFVAHNWVAEFYIEPTFHFKYYGFEWVRSLGCYTYILFAINFFSALGIALGYKYRFSAILFFLSFTYCELIDKTTYLNHYYFVSLVAFLMVFLPANRYFSIDAKQNPEIEHEKIPRYNIFILQLMLSIVYFYAGLAKINSDWLFHAMPLQIWLTGKYDLPLLGEILQQTWVHYFMSWSGMLYDITIPFLLFYRKTRVFAFILVVVFHIFTRILFPIGIFPFVMIFSTLIFFDSSFHEKIITLIKKTFKISRRTSSRSLHWVPSLKNRFITSLFILFFVFQFLFPFRYLLYPGELFWNEEGFRFSWRVMLIEKGAYTQFKVVNPENGNWFYVENSKFLSDFQQKQLGTQPDFMVQFAYFLKQHYEKEGIKNPEVYVDSHVALNGRLSQRFIDPNTDLTKVENSWKPKTWILPFNNTIYGF